MFLDSGNIISDETFCTQSNNGGKSSRIFSRISLPSSGDGKRPRYWTRKTMCPGGESRRPSEYTKRGLD